MLSISKALSSGQAPTYHKMEFTSGTQSYYKQDGAVERELFQQAPRATPASRKFNCERVSEHMRVVTLCTSVDSPDVCQLEESFPVRPLERLGSTARVPVA